MFNFLSASTVKELEKCTWKYWCRKHLKLPDSGNSGASRGTICHAILELLLNRREYAEKIIERGDIKAIPSVDRLVKIYIHYDEYLDEFDNKGEDNYRLINEMILVGLNTNYYREGEKLLEPELYFEIKNEEPRYNFRGYIDKLSEKDGRYYIVDYKSSSSPFTDYELLMEIQAAAYSLWAYKQGKKSSVEFVFLRFPDNPIRKVEYTEEQLIGFEYYFSGWQDYIDNINANSAMCGMADDKGYPPKEHGFAGRLMCGYAKSPKHIKPATGEVYYYCPYKFKFYYWAAVDENGEVKMTFSLDKEGDALIYCYENSCSIQKKFYGGCPSHQNLNREFPDDWQENVSG